MKRISSVGDNTRSSARGNMRSDTRSSTTSILGLATSHTMINVLICAGVLLVIQGCVFLYFGWNQGDNPTLFYQWMDCIVVKYSFIAALLIAVLSAAFAGVGNAKTEYTMGRLGVSYKKIFLIWMLNTACVVLIIWGTQVATVFLGSLFYRMMTPEGIVSIQHVFLTVYRSEFTHLILPYGDATLWLRSVGLWIYLAAGAGYYAVQRFRGERSMVNIISIFFVLAYFNIESNQFNLYVGPFLLLCAIFLIHGGMYDEI